MEEILCNISAREIDDAQFLRIESAYNICLALLWIEEKFNIITGNYYDLEQEIEENYNYFLVNQSSDSNCNILFHKYGSEKIVVLNRKLNNLLSSIRLYQDQTFHELSTLEKQLGITDLVKKFKDKTHELYDESLAYQLLELMRNHMQHQGLIIERITAIIPLFKRNVESELWYFIETNHKKVRLIDKFNQKINLKKELQTQGEWINLIGMIREYYIQLIKLHNTFREITSKILDDAIKNISDVKRIYYHDMPVLKIAFYGKKGNDSFEDFLLQFNYIEKIINYRQDVPSVDISKYFIGKRVFMDMSKIKVSNSTTCSIRYNM
ncbi:MAG: hypothetical protein E6348_04215 [Clostridium celatum]|nr:hypothetical protein [Clostridium celatum]MDU7076067.1 hypothetical protein [Clostridium celatum]